MRWPTSKTLSMASRMRPLWKQQRGNNITPTRISAVGCQRFISAETETRFRETGYLDEEGLTQFETLHELQVRACQVYSGNDSFGTYQESTNSFEYMTYEQYDECVDACRTVLMDLGIQKFDKVAIISNNRWEWATIAAAAYSLSATLVPMYEAQLETDWTYILNDSGSRVVVCANEDIFARVQKTVLPSTPAVQACICLDAEEGKEYAFSTHMSRARAKASNVQAPTPEDLAELIYTSGTTGKPKGVELTHANFASNVKGSRIMGGYPKELVREDDKSLAFLPWAHSYGQTCELWMSISMGAGMAICRGVPSLLEDLQLAKPTTLYSVPTLYKKVFDGVHNLMENASPLRKNLMKTALDLGARNADHRNGTGAPLGMVDRMKFSALDKIVLSKIRDRFGGNMRHGFVAGAACSPEVLEFMDSLGIPICEGYGLTETSPIISINVPNQRSIGSVGQAIHGVKVYVVDDEGNPLPAGKEGEICCVGPNIMRGYHNNTEATDEVISVGPNGERMFHTGDLGQMDADGWVKVTGRLKEQYKLENGKYIVPTPIETAIGMSRFVSQVVLCGANRPFNVALLVPEWPAIRSELGLDDSVTEEDMANDPNVMSLIDDELEKNCSSLKKFEIPQKWAFVAPFTAANNLITPKMSIRRHKVMEAYEDVISVMYGEDPVVPCNADGAHRDAA
eukprot:CAMPEP_0117030720 /NCGR_PEP_ID=MMETSP0472-20121206/22150_1 /TAXON_ID=693140 ORGANISM="Tiarina fusus, Strain LIS" /NCGR_SAMPLE_ID=MMETSP0472 /ASSEMBLY_ACC=CAM_ASM_000603 /LENGTH=682 /DNA_ID=CAMNT_0004738871 /DNA_START=125 /DNA_END=2173 /DNA_ORIENTATION=+